jgi:hypothetical protein
VFVIIKNAIRNCKLENGREREPAGRHVVYGLFIDFYAPKLMTDPRFRGVAGIIVDMYVPTGVVMRSSYRALDSPTKKERERERGQEREAEGKRDHRKGSGQMRNLQRVTG